MMGNKEYTGERSNAGSSACMNNHKEEKCQQK
jgi:hypothetical protein